MNYYMISTIVFMLICVGLLIVNVQLGKLMDEAESKYAELDMRINEANRHMDYTHCGTSIVSRLFFDEMVFYFKYIKFGGNLGPRPYLSIKGAVEAELWEQFNSTNEALQDCNMQNAKLAEENEKLRNFVKATADKMIEKILG
jgi:hypothetical protein